MCGGEELTAPPADARWRYRSVGLGEGPVVAWTRDRHNHEQCIIPYETTRYPLSRHRPRRAPTPPRAWPGATHLVRCRRDYWCRDLRYHWYCSRRRRRASWCWTRLNAVVCDNSDCLWFYGAVLCRICRSRPQLGV